MELWDLEAILGFTLYWSSSWGKGECKGGTKLSTDVLNWLMLSLVGTCFSQTVCWGAYEDQGGLIMCCVNQYSYEKKLKQRYIVKKSQLYWMGYSKKVKWGIYAENLNGLCERQTPGDKAGLEKREHQANPGNAWGRKQETLSLPTLVGELPFLGLFIFMPSSTMNGSSLTTIQGSS